MREKLVLGTIATLLLLAISSISFAYNTEDVKDPLGRVGGHEQIADRAANVARTNGLPITANLAAVRLGVRDEDSGKNSLRHFYNPHTFQGLFGVLQTAKTNAESWYDRAKSERSWYALGRAMHLVQDMGPEGRC